ncbi:unnamed protein product [Eretmochelys imbricata]
MCIFSSGTDAVLVVRSLWRNGRARWTSNPEVPGSSPGRDDLQAGVFYFALTQLLANPAWGQDVELHKTASGVSVWGWVGEAGGCFWHECWSAGSGGCWTC